MESMKNITINHTHLIDTVVEAVGEHTFIDSMLAKLPQETLQKVIAEVMSEHGLEFQ
ncbi:hypothetical protein [Pseudobacillus badius]|uniref:hypothetical protein n=1 Tax=Bacillus badius TaxID=1455 RepID=UPI0024A3F190|nr:hypothetical protein [Bacillus badius]GLY12506.1 hypothetical protein Bbad01_37220 [Bacillus badius]